MIDVTCAVIRNEDLKVLVVQRGEATDHPFKWEFPGGKVSPGESEEDCVIREVHEELSMEIIICGRLPEVKHNYGFKQIKLIPFICDTLDDKPVLTEHIGYRWVGPNDLDSIDFSEADIFVCRDYLEKAGTEVSQTVPEPGLLAEVHRGNLNGEEEELHMFVANMMSMKEAEWVAASAVERREIFHKLYEFSFSDEKHLSFRASWTLTKVVDMYPEIIHPYLSEIAGSLGKIKYESTLRSFLRILSFSDLTLINSSQHGMLADFCFNILNSANTAIAVKAYTMEILYRLSLIYPDIASELSISLRLIMEDGTAAIKSRGNAILKKLVEIPIKPKSNRK